MAGVSFLNFAEEEQDCIFLEDISPVDPFPFWSVGSGSDDRENQVNFVIDLFHQRVEQSHFLEPVHDWSTGVIIEESDELGINCLGLELGLGLGSGVELDDDDDNSGGYIVSECGDEFFIARRESSYGNTGSSSRVVEFESDSEAEAEDGDELLGINVHSEEEDYEVDNVNYDDASIHLCWDSLQLEDHVEEETNNEFEWEQVDGRGYVREVLSVVEGAHDEEESIFPILGEERERGLGNLEWEVLLNVNNLDRNPNMVENDDYIYTTEYEMMFGQFTDGENLGISRPPTSKSVVQRLPSVVITEEDVMNERALCAVCIDHIEAGEKAKELPCSHKYHGDCILPWLGIQNTCPVCRYELPTDDPDYEQRRIRMAGRVA